MVSEEKKKKLIKEIKEFKLPYDKDVIKEDGRKKIVNWEKIAEMEKNAREGTDSIKLLHGTYDELIRVGILSLNPEGNYQLTGDSILLNPRSHGLLPLYFRRKTDAEGYKRAMFSRALYTVDIFKLS